MSSDLSEFFGEKTAMRGKGRCPVCGEPTEIAVQIRAISDGGRAGARSKTHARSYCAVHGIERFNEGAEALRDTA